GNTHSSYKYFYIKPFPPEKITKKQVASFCSVFASGAFNRDDELTVQKLEKVEQVVNQGSASYN
ncbi:MAG: hypothetical protein HC874_30500, partial [Richelia sp. SL_2_1]|nr:hypothetical protein [Richelia sp. SL_2_1]